LNIVIIIILAVIFLLLGIWFFSSVYVELIYQKNELNQKAEVLVKYHFFKKKIAPPDTKKKKKSKKAEKNKESLEKQSSFDYYKNKTEEALRVFNALKEDIADILKYCRERLITVERLDFDFVFGLDDPMYTGMANGLIYGAVYNILAFIHNNSGIRKSSVNITPDFDRECHNIKFHCILRLKNVHIIVIIVKTVKMYYKVKKVTKERK
jgi:hypothetical protein